VQAVGSARKFGDLEFEERIVGRKSPEALERLTEDLSLQTTLRWDARMLEVAAPASPGTRPPARRRNPIGRGREDLDGVGPDDPSGHLRDADDG
jgi:hypothetical protein